MALCLYAVATSVAQEAQRTKIVLADMILAGSVFLGVDTVQGPLYLPYRHAQGNISLLNLVLGQTF